MIVLKCKMCGGDIELTSDKTFGTCEYCGNTTTLPKIDDEQRAAAFNRGNHFRRIGEFDKALAVYERIIQENDSDAEAHWCCALCRFGIEYVEDPSTYEWLPTCHRVSFDSFLEDVDYKAALEYSEGITQRQYMKDGAKIAEVQKGILITSQNTEPYDVFICYKESDENGERTRDSLMAQEIYYQLVEQGRKVFFARITLEDVVGTQYEPYIFAALNSAKVMIVVGSKPEYLNAVWVKNEWSRFLAMMKKDHQKLLLPCYKDMDPYDMPEQLSVLQSYDMSKIGFIQDLTRGIAKVLDADKKTEIVQETVVVQQSGVTNIAPLLKRVFMFLEDEDWNSADEYCEKVLDADPECARAYLGKLMAKLKVKKTEQLVDCKETFKEEFLYKKVIRFADVDLKNQLETYNEEIRERNEAIRCQGIYQKATDKMISAKKSQTFLDAAMFFESIQGFLDSDTLKIECYTKAEEYLEKEKVAEKDAIYKEACDLLNKPYIFSVRSAIEMFKKINDWRDSSVKIQEALNKIDELLEVEANEKKDTTYNRACKNQMNGDLRALTSAIRDFELIKGWRDADERACACQKMIDEIKLKEEAERLEKEHKEEEERLEKERQAELARQNAEKKAKRNKKLAFGVVAIIGCIISFFVILNTVIIPNNSYKVALSLMEEEKYEDAIAAFEKFGQDGYKDSIIKIDECYSCIYGEDVWNEYKNLKVGDMYTFGTYEQDNNTSNGSEDIDWKILAKDGTKILVISKFALDYQKYHEFDADVTWEKSTLREWLNDEFIKLAFSNEEQSMIPDVTVSADRNPKESTDPGHDTIDKIFVLSVVEANKYFGSDKERICRATSYATKNVEEKLDSIYSWWWLRTPGGNQNIVAFVDENGSISQGYFSYHKSTCVRPAMWIDLATTFK